MPATVSEAAYPRWANAVLYQGVWFVAVLGRESLVVLAFALVALHLALVRRRAPATLRRELVVLLAVAALGIAVDSALTLGGLFAFDPTPAALPIPLWLAAIWLAFAATFRHAIAVVLARPPLAIVAGAIGGPLSYVAAARLDAVALPHGALATALALAVVWASLMAAFVALVRRVNRVGTASVTS